MPQSVTQKEGKNVALASMITPDVLTDVFRANGGILLLRELTIIDEELAVQFADCFDQLRNRLLETKGIVATR